MAFLKSHHENMVAFSWARSKCCVNKRRCNASGGIGQLVRSWEKWADSPSTISLEAEEFMVRQSLLRLGRLEYRLSIVKVRKFNDVMAG